MSKQILNFINGEFVSAKSGKTFENLSPVDGSLVGMVSEAGKEEVDAAVKAARAALEGPWGGMDIAKRSELLYAVADEINRRFKDFLDAEVADTGKPHVLASHIDIPRGAANFKIFADVVKNVPTESFQMTTPDGGAAFNYAMRVPKGVIAVIAPWNLPLLLDDLEGRSGACLRQYRRRQAVGGNAVDRDAARRSDERGRRAEGRLQRRARLRPEFRR